MRPGHIQRITDFASRVKDPYPDVPEVNTNGRPEPYRYLSRNLIPNTSSKQKKHQLGTGSKISLTILVQLIPSNVGCVGGMLFCAPHGIEHHSAPSPTEQVRPVGIPDPVNISTLVMIPGCWS